MNVKILHNPRCSKSRQTLALLTDKGIEPEIIEYLDAPPTPSELRDILEQLGVGPRDIIRKGEKIYKELDLADATLPDSALITAMTEHPILIERPIVLNDGKASIGRPPESVLDIL